MFAVVVGETTRELKVALIVKSRVQGSVTTGSGVCGLRERVGALKVSSVPAARDRGLERVIVRIGVISKELHAAVAVNALKTGTSYAICDGAFSNLELGS